MKVGILTHYYKSPNYGGVLQAYALSRVLNGMEGVEGEQICYDMTSRIENPDVLISRGAKLRESKPSEVLAKLPGLFSHASRLLWRKTPFYRKKNACVQASLTTRAARFAQFREKVIPNSGDVFTAQNIGETNKRYDCFITGSDQVFNPQGYDDVFFLDFVRSGKYKFSYAASVCASKLYKSQERVYREKLASFDAVSVRETKSLPLLSPLSPVSVEQTADPTLLLDAASWDEIAAPQMFDRPYLFCYFLGNDKKERKLACQFARLHDLLLVTIPYVSGAYGASDAKFGQHRVLDAGPAEFLSLVRHAAYVFTDSFHGVAFSHIFGKQFVAFGRQGAGNMSDRVATLTSFFGTGSRFCNTRGKRKLSYICALPQTIYGEREEAFAKLKRQSLRFITENLQKAREKKYES